MKSWLGLILVSWTTVVYSQPVTKVICTLANDKKAISLTAPLSHKTLTLLTEKNLRIGPESYMFSVEIENTEASIYNIAATIHETRLAQDEVGSISCSFDAESESNEALCVDSLENEDEILAQFECVKIRE